MDFNEALAYLLGLGHETVAIKLGLAKTELLLAALENPQDKYFKVQIAGTNGKGSTAAFLEAICISAGIRTGLYTSPHLVKITERIRINGTEIEEGLFAQLVSLVRDSSSELINSSQLETPPTFFEHVTAIALIAFARADVEVAILETGLGGRLDSTTAAGAELVSITPVDFDHQEYLGETLSLIAAEKAAIIHHGVTAVIASQKREALEVILNRCAEFNVNPVLVQEADWKITNKTPDGHLEAAFKVEAGWLDAIVPALPGRHQLSNAATAIAIAVELKKAGFPVSKESIATGLQTARHFGRLEWIPGDPPILLDGAHNPHGARALAAYLREFVDGPITLVFAAMRDKDLKAVLNELAPLASSIVLTIADNPRSATTEELKAVLDSLPYRPKTFMAETVSEAIEIARRIKAGEGSICVAGSLYLIGEARAWLNPGV